MKSLPLPLSTPLLVVAVVFVAEVGFVVVAVVGAGPEDVVPTTGPAETVEPELAVIEMLTGSLFVAVVDVVSEMP